MKHSGAGGQYVVCVQNYGYEVSLEKRKIYWAVSDKKTAGHGLPRIVDESGQSYLYPERLFVAIRLPQPVLKALSRAAWGLTICLILDTVGW